MAIPPGQNSGLPLVDPIFDEQVRGYQSRLRTDLAGLGAQRSQGLGSYGYTEGASGGLAFDPNNPFSKAALLKKTYNTSRARSAQTMGSTGNLYAGSFQNQQDLVNRGQLQDEDALQKSLASFLAENTFGRRRAQEGYEESVGLARGERVGRLESGDNPLYEPMAVPSAGGVSATGGKPVTATKGPLQQQAAFERERARARNQSAAAVARARARRR